MKRKLGLLSCCCFLLFAVINLHGQNSGSEYSIINKISLPGNGGWDYLTVDELGLRLFVSHSSVVQVIDLKTGQLAGTINDTPGVHGIAIAPDLNKAFISEGQSSAIKVINLQTLAVITDVKIAGKNPDAIIYDQFSKRVFAFNGASSNATVLDAVTNEVLGNIPLDGVKFDPTMKRVFTSNGEGTMTVVQEVSKDSFKVLENFPTASGARTLALDTKTHHIYMSAAESNAGSGGNGRPGMSQGSFFVMDIGPLKN